MEICRSLWWQQVKGNSICRLSAGLMAIVCLVTMCLSVAQADNLAVRRVSTQPHHSVAHDQSSAAKNHLSGIHYKSQDRHAWQSVAAVAQTSELGANNVMSPDLEQLLEQVNGLQNQEGQLTQKLQALQQQMLAMQQQLSLLTVNSQFFTWTQHMHTALGQWSQHMQMVLGATGFKLVTGLCSIFIFWLVWSLRPRRKHKQTVQQLAEVSRVTAVAISELQDLKKMQQYQLSPAADSNAEPTETEEGEYDFLNTSDAIPTKLDLARAYIAMDNAKAARLVLQEVIAQGNAKQQQIARKLCVSLDEMELS